MFISLYQLFLYLILGAFCGGFLYDVQNLILLACCSWFTSQGTNYISYDVNLFGSHFTTASTDGMRISCISLLMIVFQDGLQRHII